MKISRPPDHTHAPLTSAPSGVSPEYDLGGASYDTRAARIEPNDSVLRATQALSPSMQPKVVP